MTTATKTKPMIPSLSHRSRVFPSGAIAAASLNIPAEVIKLARIRGAPCFHASNRVHEGPLLEFILEELIEYFPPLPEEKARDIGFNYALTEVLEAGPSYEKTFTNGQFQLMRLIWGDESAIAARDLRLKELRRIAAIVIPAVLVFQQDAGGKEFSPYAYAGLNSLDEWDLSRDPFASIGADKLDFWTIGERWIDLKAREIFDGAEWVALDHSNNFPPCLILPTGKSPGLMPPTRHAKTINWAGLLPGGDLE